MHDGDSIHAVKDDLAAPAVQQMRLYIRSKINIVDIPKSPYPPIIIIRAVQALSFQIDKFHVMYVHGGVPADGVALIEKSVVQVQGIVSPVYLQGRCPRSAGDTGAVANGGGEDDVILKNDFMDSSIVIRGFELCRSRYKLVSGCAIIPFAGFAQRAA
jgi:hypothetical protein